MFETPLIKLLIASNFTRSRARSLLHGWSSGARPAPAHGSGPRCGEKGHPHLLFSQCSQTYLAWSMCPCGDGYCPELVSSGHLAALRRSLQLPPAPPFPPLSRCPHRRHRPPASPPPLWGPHSTAGRIKGYRPPDLKREKGLDKRCGPGG